MKVLRYFGFLGKTEILYFDDVFSAGKTIGFIPAGVFFGNSNHL